MAEEERTRKHPPTEDNEMEQDEGGPTSSCWKPKTKNSKEKEKENGVPTLAAIAT